MIRQCPRLSSGVFYGQIVHGPLALTLAITCCSSVNAAAVGPRAHFQGAFINQTLPGGGGAGSALGAVPPTVNFTFIDITTTDGAGIQTINPGGNWLGMPNMTVVGGTVQFTDNGVNDIAQFSINVSSTGGPLPNGQINFNFTGNLFSGGSIVNSANYASLVFSPNATTSVSYLDFGNAQLSSYTGTITAVPEPSTYALMLGVAAVAGGLRWRRNRITK